MNNHGQIWHAKHKTRSAFLDLKWQFENSGYPAEAQHGDSRPVLSTEGNTSGGIHHFSWTAQQYLVNDTTRGAILSEHFKMANWFQLAQINIQVAKATVLAFSRTIPPAVPGVVFLSGGQVGPSYPYHHHKNHSDLSFIEFWMQYMFVPGLLASLLKSWNIYPFIHFIHL